MFTRLVQDFMAASATWTTPTISALNIAATATLSNEKETTFRTIIANVTAVESCQETSNCEHRAPRIASYVIPIVFLLGVAGNLLTILIYAQHPRRRPSTGNGSGSSASSASGILLCWMSAANVAVYLFGLVPLWLSVSNLWVYSDTPVSCRLFNFLHEGSRMVTGWLLVAFSVLRAFAVCRPLSIITGFRSRSTIVACGCVVAVAAAVNVHVFWTMGAYADAATTTCFHCFHSEFEFFQSHTEWLTVVLTYGLPFCAVLLFNVAIVYAMCRRSVVWNQHPNSMMTAICLSASFVYCFFAVPALVMSLVAGSMQSADVDDPSWSSSCTVVVVDWIVYMLIYVGYSTNFFVYCLASSQFRAELKTVLQRCRRTSSSYRLQQTPSAAGIEMVTLCGLDRRLMSVTMLVDQPSASSPAVGGRSLNSHI